MDQLASKYEITNKCPICNLCTLNRTHHFDNMNEAHATVLLKIVFINKAVLRQSL